MIRYVEFPQWFRYDAIAIWPFIFVRKQLQDAPRKVHDTIIRHERIHHRQQLELGIIGFYLLYLIEFAAGLIVYSYIDTAYRDISFEKEAYVCQSINDYLDTRKPYAWLRYLFV